MANRSVTTRRTGASSTQASAIGAYATASNSYTLIGSTINVNTQFSVANIQFGAPGVTVPGTSLNSPVVLPTISSIAYTNTNYIVRSTGANAAVANTAGAVRVLGSNFLSNAQVYLAGNVVSTYYLTSGELRFAYTGGTVGTANTLMVFNSPVSGVIWPAGIQWQTAPVWVTYSYNTLFPGAVNFSLIASVDTGAVSYRVSSGSSLPTDFTLNASTGALSGNIAVQGTYTFNVDAVNLYNQTTTQTVTIGVGQSYTVNYLIVGGGGSGAGAPVTAGGISSGGGGGGVLSGTYNLTPALLTIAVGQGGIGRTVPGTVPGLNGGNSYITGGTIGNIVAVGGGGGSVSAGSQPGGSGGGGGSTFTPTAAGQGFGYPSPAGTFYTPVGAQGYPGGQAVPYPGSPSLTGAGAGGGGGGGIGNPGVVSTPWRGGAGGAGYTWPVNGNTYAGGGGGNSGGFSGGPSGAGGPGGGGQGGGVGGDLLGNGTNGLGGGGGAGAPAGYVSAASAAGTGGSGVVIIAYPSVPGAQIGSGGTVTTTGTGPALYYLHTYTAPGTYTATTTPTWVTASILSNVQVNQSFSYTLSATDVNTITYTVAVGNTLPAGTTLTTGGVFSGTPTVTGSYTFYVNATNVIGGTTNRQFTIGVYAYQMNYLAVGGGGGGGGYGNSSAGLQGTPGGQVNGIIDVFSTGTVYNISVGPGGGGAQPSGFSNGMLGTPGTPSTIAGPGLTTITGVGGGGGNGGPLAGVGPGAGNGPPLTWAYNSLPYPGTTGTNAPTGTPGGLYGGGGGGRTVGPAGSGAQGIVILAVPTPAYPGTAPGASVSTPPAAPGKTVLTYTAPASYTA